MTLGQAKFTRVGRLVAGAVLSVAFCAAHAQDARQQARDAAVGDGLSTAAGLAAGAVEMNPLGPLLAIGMKAVTFHYASTLPDTQQPAVYAAAASMWSGATANNICVTAALLTGGGFAPACVVLGVAWGVKTWNDTEHERQFWEGCALLRQYANEPKLACVYDAAVAKAE
ncbi:MAG TPA: hypothetical protein VGD76_15785, partial [Ramlibacter sp.]